MARATAVLVIVVFHSLTEVLRLQLPFIWVSAFAGVDLFFSLSGFLIGRILVTLFSQTEKSLALLRNFWRKRWLRTLPLYFIVLALNSMVAMLFVNDFGFDWRYLLFMQNLCSPPGFFGESWSLSIEEWFYVAVPLLGFMYNALRNLLRSPVSGAGLVFQVAFFLIVFFNLLRWLYPGNRMENAVFYRLDSIAYGLVAACISVKEKQLANNRALVYAGLGLICWCSGILFLSAPESGILKRLYYPLSGTGTALLVLGLYYYRFRKTFPVITRISRISYSLYLVHLSLVMIPLSWWTWQLPLAARVLVWLASLLIVFTLASLSYRYVETYFLRLRDHVAGKAAK